MKNMEKKFMVVALVAVLSIVTMLSGCGSGGVVNGNESSNADSGYSSSDLPAVNWRMASTWGDGNTHFTVDKRFTELVSQLTDGKFIIKNYSAGQLGAANQVFDMVSNGTVEAGGDWAGYWSGKNTGFDLLGTTMDNFSSLDYFVWIYQGGGLKNAYQYMYNKYGLQYFPILIHTAESGFRASKPIDGIEDLKGLKIRLAGKIQGLVADKIGFTPVTVDSTELYESLQRGVIDAGEFSVPGSDYSLKLHEVAKYWWAPGWHQSAGCNGVMVNMDAWNSLPEEYQIAFETAARLCTAESMARYAWQDFNATNKMLETGVKICKYPEEDLKMIREYVQEATEVMCEENPDYKHVYDSMMAYRRMADPYKEILGDYGWGYTFDEYGYDAMYGDK